MDSIKVKNFIIVVLLIVNAILLSVFISDTVRERSRTDSAIEGAVALLAENGITVAPDVDFSERQLETLQVARDTGLEQQSVSNILGDTTVSDPGGNILLYFGANGEARFSGTGSVEMNLRSGEFRSGDPLETARTFASDLDCETMSEPVSSSIDADTLEGSLDLCCSIDGVRVVNCVLSFTFASGGDLMGVYGTRVLDTVTSSQQESTIDVPTVLMRFLNIVLDGGHVCSSLDELELCYNMRANAAGEGELIPVWRIATDTGEFYINANTGLEETIT